MQTAPSILAVSPKLRTSLSPVDTLGSPIALSVTVYVPSVLSVCLYAFIEKILVLNCPWAYSNPSAMLLSTWLVAIIIFSFGFRVPNFEDGIVAPT